jgi:hypothetical protein
MARPLSVIPSSLRAERLDPGSKTARVTRGAPDGAVRGQGELGNHKDCPTENEGDPWVGPHEQHPALRSSHLNGTLVNLFCRLAYQILILLNRL